MKKLTSELLMEEAKNFFPKINGSFNVSSLNEGYEGEAGNDIHEPVKLLTFPGYADWRNNLKEPPMFYDGATSPGWAVDKYVRHTLGLATELIEHDYPTKYVLGMLPKDFSEAVAKRMKE